MHVQDGLCLLADSPLLKSPAVPVAGAALVTLAPEAEPCCVADALLPMERRTLGLLEALRAVSGGVESEPAGNDGTVPQQGQEIGAEEKPAAAESQALQPRAAPTVRPPSPSDRYTKAEKKARLPLAAAMVTGLASASLAWSFMSGPDACHPEKGAGRAPARALVNAIVRAESGGNALAKNELSSATGAGQFLNATWLEMIRAHRPDLNGASEEKVLALRKDSELSRDMVARLAERNAGILARNCLPVNAGTLYLSHFAGGGGAVAVLSAPDHADAAATMASGDSKGKLTREMIVTANPFLRDFTVADLKSWAERRVRGALSLARNQEL